MRNCDRTIRVLIVSVIWLRNFNVLASMHNLSHSSSMTCEAFVFCAFPTYKVAVELSVDGKRVAIVN